MNEQTVLEMRGYHGMWLRVGWVPYTRTIVLTLFQGDDTTMLSGHFPPNEVRRMANQLIKWFIGRRAA